MVASPFSTTSQVSKYEEGPERDLVNFPRPKRAVDPPAVTFGFIPESFNKFFYPKTGVTGSWTFGVGLVTYLISKEIWVLEHEFYGGVSLFIVVAVLIKKFGKQTGESVRGMVQRYADGLNAGKVADIKSSEIGIEEEKKAQWRAEGEVMLFNAKRENVAFQLEAAYRQRLADVYSEVKKRLDYQVEKLNVERNVQQKHMVNWIVNKVTKSITADQEAENIRKCIADLKGLAARA
jgi:F-type H+-transporting ATPase subunit b